jgi:glycosyltransferase involved in cell wall biosynthesis
MRVLLLTNILAPYRVPAFQALAATPGLTLRVLVNAATEFDRSWTVDPGGLDVETLPGVAWVLGGRTLHVPSPAAVWGALARFRPDAVISAELGARTLFAAAACAARRVPLVVWVEPTRASLGAAGRLRRALGPRLLARAAAVVVPGSEARLAVRAWGVPEARVVTAPNAHDAEGFDKALAGLDRDAARRDLRAGIAGRDRIALVAGRLLPVKGIDAVLAAWDRLPADLRSGWTLLFVGDGPLAGRVAEARAAHAPGEIARLPALEPRELAGIYAASDLLVFPSLGDVWGFAVNEAMACELPVVCSSRAGCAADLVVPNETGWLADPADPGAFAERLAEAMRCDHRERIAARARERIAAFTPEAMAAGFRSALQVVLNF